VIVADDHAKHLRGMGDSKQAILVEFDGRATTEQELTRVAGRGSLLSESGNGTYCGPSPFREADDIRAARCSSLPWTRA
jgi:hypothetical protein